MMKSYFAIVVVQVKIKNKNKISKKKKKEKPEEHEWKVQQGWETIEHKCGKVQGEGGAPAAGVGRRKSCRSFEGEV